MRIDPKMQIPGAIQSENLQDSKVTLGQQPSSGGLDVTGGVQVELSTDSAQVGQLAQQAASLPAVRSNRVAALSQAIRSGGYSVTNEQIASAMYADMFQPGTKA